MGTFVWPADKGWSYPDNPGPDDARLTELEAGMDDDTLCVRAGSSHLMESLDELERTVIQARYGLAGEPPRSMKQLRNDLGLSRSEVRQVLGSGLEKLRSQLRT